MSQVTSISSTDELQLRQYKSTGDQEILGKLYNNYMHLVYGLCLKYLKDTSASQDAVMDIYEHISHKLLSIEVKHFKSWLYMVSKNHCLMKLRKKSPEIQADFFMESADVVHLKEASTALEKDLEALEACITLLKADQKACVKLFFLEKKSYHQVNEETGIALNKVKSHIQNGKRNLKNCLERQHVSR